MLRTDRLPPLPHAQTQALSALNDPDVSLVDVAEVIETDPALTATLLRAANSVASAPIDRIASARVAAIRIGLHPTRNLVMGTVMTSLSTDFSRAGIDTDELWRHALACALLVDGAVRSDGAAHSAGFTAGLMHDIGRIAMAQIDPDRYRKVAGRVRSGVEAIEAERDVFGSDHCEWGADVARAWAVPEDIVGAIGGHHGAPPRELTDEQTEEQTGELARAIEQAHAVLRALGIGNGLQPPDVEPLESPAALDPEQQALLDGAGGAEELFTQIDWFRGAFAIAG